jgi:hypothetical protein
MAKGKRSGAGHKVCYTRYKQENRIAKNRKIRLERALKKNPENEEIRIALTGALGQRRDIPKGQVWSASRVRIAKLYKDFTGTVNMDMFSKNEKVSAPALMTPGHKSKHIPNPDTKAMFSLLTRIS